MKSIFLLSVLFSSFAFAGEGNLDCENVIDISESKGQTYLAFMQETVVPELNQMATQGYELVGADTIKAALENVDSKVATNAIKAAGSEQALLTLATKLEGKTATLYNLPEMISKTAKVSDRYGLATFFGLASCGGAVIKYSKNNYAYNIHYGTGENDKDDRTGRSFGEGPSRNANDASDKNYLTDLETFVFKYPKTMPAFYNTLVSALANSDTSGYPKIAEFGQTLLTDFLAVYTAEQARNLMDGRITLHWDAALLEVTLLGSFHAGQDKIMLYYKDPGEKEVYFTDKVLNQAPGCTIERDSKKRSARLYDYWQFSKSNDPANCKRSGINITKDEFRTLGQDISDYERKKNPEIVAAVESHFSQKNRGGNVYQELSNHFINAYAKSEMGATEAKTLAKDMTAFLMQVNKDAKAITKSLSK